jgi:small subunit ribosomal protein S20
MGYNPGAFWQGNERGRTHLANTHSAIKRIRSNERKRQVNLLHRTRARTYVKRARRLIFTGKLGEAEAMTNHAASALDKAAQKGVIHRNTAARRKSRLMRRLNQARQQKAA